MRVSKTLSAPAPAALRDRRWTAAPTLLLLLLLVLVSLASVRSATTNTHTPSRTAASPPALPPSERTVEHYDGKMVVFHKHKPRPVPPKVDPTLIQAPRRFVPHRVGPTCEEGTTADHKGKCREYW